MEKNRKEINKPDDLIKRSDLLERIRVFTSISNGYFENPELLERVVREMPAAPPVCVGIVSFDEEELRRIVDERVEGIEEFDIATQGYSKGYSVGKDDGYEQGLNDAWELAKKCVLFDGRGEDNELMMEIFGTVFLDKLFNNNTYQEALAKLKAYEEAQNKICVGDVVEFCTNGKKYLIISEEDDGDYNFGVINLQSMKIDRICTTTFAFKKTCKHIDISSILEQIGEQGGCK